MQFFFKLQYYITKIILNIFIKYTQFNVTKKIYLFFLRSPSDCQKYFLCIDGKPRRLTCGGYSAFDELTESCVAADEVEDCPTELRNEAKKSRDAEKQRLTAQAAFEKLRFAPKNTYEYATTQAPFYEPEQDVIENETQTPQPLIY